MCGTYEHQVCYERREGVAEHLRHQYSLGRTGIIYVRLHATVGIRADILEGGEEASKGESPCLRVLIRDLVDDRLVLRTVIAQMNIMTDPTFNGRLKYVLRTRTTLRELEPPPGNEPAALSLEAWRFSDIPRASAKRMNRTPIRKV